MNEQETIALNRRVMIHTLAVVGFIALIGASIWLAVYSTRYVPDVVNRIGAAAVYLGSVFVPADEPSLSVVPTATSTNPLVQASSTASTTSTTGKPATKPATQTTAGTKTNNAYQIGGFASTSPLFGTPDLVVRINAVGYLATTSAESFVASTTVPSGARPAVNFTIKNIGTNVTGSWRFSATIPTQSAFLFLSQPQQSLAPGDSIDYTLGFDQANKGADQMISVTANYDRAVGESSTENNSASAKLTIIGP